MERTAFARALRFLNYHATAKWSALLAAVGAGVLFLGLLVVLGLFADLLVNHGDIPCYANLPSWEKNYFRRQLPVSEDTGEKQQRAAELRQRLQAVGLDEARWLPLVTTDQPEKLSTREQDLRLDLLWFLELPAWLQDTVGAAAAETVRQHQKKHVWQWGPEIALHHNLEDYGILGLVVRTRGSFQGWLVASLAGWDWAWRQGNTFYLQSLFLAALVLAVLRAGLLFAGDYLAALATLAALTRLRRALYHQTYRLGILVFSALGPSEAISVSTRHLEAVHDGLYAWLTVVFREPIKFGLTLLFALLVHFWLAVAFLMFALLVWLIGGQVAAYVRRQGRSASQVAADQLVLIQESLMMMRLVKVYLMEPFNQVRLERQLARYGEALRCRYGGEAFYRPLLAFLGLLAALGLLLIGGVVILQGQVGVTNALVLAAALVSLYWPLQSWLEHRRLLRRARQSAEVLFQFLARPGGVGQMVGADFVDHLGQQLEFDQVTLQEPGSGRRLLQGVSLTITAGQRVALVGPDDLEKHALVYLIPRFLDPTSGEIRLDGRNLRWVTLDSLRAQIALVLQHHLVFNDTAANNIGCGEPSFTLPRIIEAAKTAHAHQFIQKLPQGYDTVIGELGQPLSISEQFRIGLARAILRDPALYIIEEPLSPLDEDTKAWLDDTFARVLPGKTVIFLPHRLPTIRHCDRIFLLSNGRIEAVGDHRELLAQNDLYRHLQYLEFNEFANLFSGPQEG